MSVFTEASEPDPEVAEAGRLLFAGPVAFLKGVTAMAGLPPADRLEVCFAGRSNVGKSSLISALVRQVREQERTIGVISVDPSSPFTHGALLGDRIRLADHFLDPGVFIRSMGTRGHLGGLAEAR